MPELEGWTLTCGHFRALPPEPQVPKRIGPWTIGDEVVCYECPYTPFGPLQGSTPRERQALRIFLGMFDARGSLLRKAR